MTFNSVISSLRAGYSAYTPTMRGYLSRTDEVFTAADLPAVNTPFSSWEGTESDWTTARGHYAIPVTKTGEVFDEPKGITEIAHFTFIENYDIDPETGTTPVTSDGMKYAFTRYTYTDGTVAWFAPNKRSNEAVDSGHRNVWTPLVLDAQLFPAMVSSDWETATTADTEVRKASLNATTRW